MADRFCVNCIHVRHDPHSRSSPWYVCTRLRRPLSPVTGLQVGEYPTCGTTRSPEGVCGPDGIFYVDKLTAERKREQDAERLRKGERFEEDVDTKVEELKGSAGDSKDDKDKPE